MSDLKEADIRDYLLKCLKEVRGEIRKVKWIGRHGAPDELVMLPGFFCFVELKAPGEVPRQSQVREHKRLRRAGVPVVVIDSYLGVERLVYERRVT